MCCAHKHLTPPKYRSSTASSFQAICPHITKEDCIKAQRSNPVKSLPPEQGHIVHPDRQPPTPPVSHCDRIHFRPLIRPHTDPALGHCSYLNTCYSEPTYALSPSIPPPQNTGTGGRIANTNAVSLPQGLGAGGRGKEKAPCRYLHFEVDYDGPIPADTKQTETANNDALENVPRLEIGLGPTGKRSGLVSKQCAFSQFTLMYFSAPTSVDKL